MQRETNREIALRRFEKIVRPLVGMPCFGRKTVDDWRRELRMGSRDELVETARRMDKHARCARRRDRFDREAAFIGLADAFRLAATEDARAGCCGKDHANRLGRGPGERRDECARVSSCLATFVRAEQRATSAHCPNECAGFVPAARLLPTHRPVDFAHRASLTSDGSARTGIY